MIRVACLGVFLGAALLVGCGDSGPGSEPDARVLDAAGPDAGTGPNPISVYVTLAGELGGDKTLWTCEAFPDLRQRFLSLADALQERSVPYSLLVARPFLEAVVRCESDEDRAETSGLNLVDFLARQRGVEVVPWIPRNTAEGWNFADLKALADTLSGAVAEVAAGPVWNDPRAVAELLSGQVGLEDPSASWRPELLACAVSSEGDGSRDDRTSGIWNPAGSDARFYEHDPEGKVTYVGPGWWETDWRGQGDLAFSSTVDYVRLLVRYQLRGEIPVGQVYTATWRLPEAVTTDEGPARDRFWELLEQLLQLVEDGHVVLVQYEDVAAVWHGPYRSRACFLPIQQVDPEDLPPGT